MRDLACLNGELMPADQARVPIWDRGFLFGDSVYEVFRLYQGRCWLEEEHNARLRRSLSEMEFPEVDLDVLGDRIRRTIEASGIEEGMAYIHITRGVAPRAHAFPNPSVPPTELIVIRPYDDRATALKREKGVGVASRPDLRWKRCDVKSTNLLANVMALESANRAGAYEALLVDDEGLVTEATHSSVLWVRDGRLEGTPNDSTILPGTTRFLTQRLAAKLDIPFAEGRISLDDFFKADEAILVGTTIEVLPIVEVDQRPIAGGKPGPITRKLQVAYRSAIEQWLAPLTA
ncbi:aminotransferase class IV [Tundrisphaera lichenicola]|uniref:aminotransferase class IV n=1 Tax=Tundrisphaera lichenicola TaxID=2029860 RepID=UPI003EBDFACB